MSPKKKVARNAPYGGRSKEDVLLKAVETSLDRFGVLLPTFEMIKNPPKHVARVKPAMSKEQTLLAVAETSLRQFGTMEPPRTVLDVLMDKKCPHCGKVGLIVDEFGLKWHAGKALRPQSWCNECRSGPDGRGKA